MGGVCVGSVCGECVCLCVQRHVGVRAHSTLHGPFVACAGHLSSSAQACSCGFCMRPTTPPTQDTFVEQLCAGAKAVVDECVGKGVVDPKRVSVGGRECGTGCQARFACVLACWRM